MSFVARSALKTAVTTFASSGARRIPRHTIPARLPSAAIPFRVDQRATFTSSSALQQDTPSSSASSSSSSASASASSSSSGSSSSSSSGGGEKRTDGKAGKGLRLDLLITAGLVGAGVYFVYQKWPGDKKPVAGAAPTKKEHEDYTVIFVLGGPGAGKGTQCANLVKDYGFVHLSAGDLLRAEMARPGSEFGDLIKNYIKEGKIVPMEVTIALLENAMKANASISRRFLIDGFPRAMDQALEFERAVCKSSAVLYFQCPEETMLERLLKRGESSGRSDDNIESIRKRFKTFVDVSMPVVDHFASEGKVITVSCLNKPEVVYQETKKKIEKIL